MLACVTQDRNQANLIGQSILAMDQDVKASTSSASGSGQSSNSSNGRQHELQREGEKEKRKLTIEGKSKIESELSKQIDLSHLPSTGAVVIKWLATFVIGSLLLAAIILSKLSITSLSERMHRTTDTQTAEKCRIFVMLLIILMVPNFVNLFRGIWGGAFRSDIPWPTRGAVIAGIGVSLLESCGICLFVFKVPGLANVKANHAMLLMNCVFFVSIAHYVYLCFKIGTNTSDLDRGRRQQHRRGTLQWRGLFLAALLFEIIGIGCTAYLIRSMDLSDIWVPILAVLCLSIAWVPGVQKYLLKTKQRVENHENLSDVAAGSGGDASGYQSYDAPITLQYEVERDMPQRENHMERAKREEELAEKPTWKMTILMSIFKIIFTLSFSTLFFVVILKEPIGNYKLGWDWSAATSSELYYFISNMLSSIAGYLLAYLACAACMQSYAFAVPLFLATPLAAILLSEKSTCMGILMKPESDCCAYGGTSSIMVLVTAVACLVLAQGCSTGWLLLRSQYVVMLKEEQLFWLPAYNPVLLEQWLLLARRNKQTDSMHMDPEESAKRSKVIICTTMYREADYEMKQLLESIGRVNLAQSEGKRHFESHIFFDGAVKDRNPTEFVLQLVALVESTLGIDPATATKIITPYGMSLSWKLAAPPGKNGMVFKIHLKDNFKVKNKKRWSQIMYMSYILDFILGNMDNATLEDTYILTTDADVRFTPDSVEALLDLMTRDHSVGAACARTHPLGSGPIVWYQVFEYAIGHWFQKAAEHVFGSVLCSPGCFSVYRCRAVLDILPKYATNVEHAFDFLTKDMGEDRWMCTLMVQSGWRIEYCAASENSTHCPEEFDEFYKQRRRWVASTLANLMLLMKEWRIVRRFNHRVSLAFLFYQAVLLIATLIGPSSVILVVSGGLVYGMGVAPDVTLILQVLICVGFTLICLFTSSHVQLTSAKVLTFIYSMIMTAVVVGMAVQIASDFVTTPNVIPEINVTTTTTTENPNFIDDSIRISTTAVYLLSMIGIFLVTGALHLGEFICLIHGIWYLLCLPSGYLMLTIYSICNITDRSWGTREEKTHSVVSKNLNWQGRFKRYFMELFFCCFKQLPAMISVGVQSAEPPMRHRAFSTDSAPGSLRPPAPYDPSASSLDQSAEQTPVKQVVPADSSSTHVKEPVSSRYIAGTAMGAESRYQGPDMSCIAEEVEDERHSTYMEDDNDEELDRDTIIAVGDWLPAELKRFAGNFTDNGFDNTMLISAMTEKELKDIGIKGKGSKKVLMDHIKLLPDYDIQAEVPDTADAWLETIGLPMYKRQFRANHIRTAKEMEVLKSFGRKDIEQELKITKTGHVKRLMYAIRKLRNPTRDEQNVMAVKKTLEGIPVHDLRTVNADENMFWEDLKQQCLMPSATAYGLDDDLKVKLGELRNMWVMIFAVSNTLWLILITTLANRGQLLTVFGANPLGLVVLVLFMVVLIMQFLAMVVHRISTLVHYLGRAPYSVESSYNTVWRFDGTSPIRDVQHDDFQAMYAKQQAQSRAASRLTHRRKARHRDAEENEPLLASGSIV